MHNGEGAPRGQEIKSRSFRPAERLSDVGSQVIGTLRGFFTRRGFKAPEGPRVKSFAPPPESEVITNVVVLPRKGADGIIRSPFEGQQLLQTKEPDSGNAYAGKPVVVNFASMPGGIPTTEGSASIGNDNLQVNPEGLIEVPEHPKI